MDSAADLYAVYNVNSFTFGASTSPSTNPIDQSPHRPVDVTPRPSIAPTGVDHSSSSSDPSSASSSSTSPPIPFAYHPSDRSQDVLEFSDEEEFYDDDDDDESYEYESYADGASDIEIGSTVYEASVAGKEPENVPDNAVYDNRKASVATVRRHPRSEPTPSVRSPPSEASSVAPSSEPDPSSAVPVPVFHLPTRSLPRKPSIKLPPPSPRSSTSKELADTWDPAWAAFKGGIISVSLDDLVATPGPSTPGPARWKENWQQPGMSEPPIYPPPPTTPSSEPTLQPTRRRSFFFRKSKKDKESDKGKSKGFVSESDAVADDPFEFAARNWADGRDLQVLKEWSWKRIPDSSISDPDQLLRTSTASDTASLGLTLSKEPSRVSGFTSSAPSVAQRRNPTTREGRFEELWHIDVIGMVKVEVRKAVRPPQVDAQGVVQKQQQQIHANFLRPSPGITFTNASLEGLSLDTGDTPERSPPILIHRHSKAHAFTIRRGFRSPPSASHHKSMTSSTPQLPSSTSVALSSAVIETTRKAVETKDGNGMILLACRKVQEAYTSTNSTKSLREYGLLSPDGAPPPPPLPTPDLPAKAKEKDPVIPMPRPGGGRSTGGPIRSPAGFLSPLSSDSEAGTASVTSSRSRSRERRNNGSRSGDERPSTASSSLSSRSSKSAGIFSIGGHPSADSRIFYNHTFVSDAPPIVDVGPNNGLYGEIDDEDFPPPRPRRSTHTEAFSTVDAQTLSQLRASQHASISGGIGLKSASSSSSAIAGLASSLNLSASTSPPTSLPPNGIKTFDPPWLVLPTRSKQEQQQQKVANLNSSFVDLGLLPRGHKRSQHSSRSGKRTRNDGGRNRSHIPTSLFDQVPDDALFMILPLWLGATDPKSAEQWPFIVPPTKTDDRQFLMVYYRYRDLLDGSAAGRQKKQSSKDKQSMSRTSERNSRSQTSSNGSVSSMKSRSHSRSGTPALTLSSPFHVIARLVSYDSLQGSGVRIPDGGISVNGPLQVAYDSMPRPTPQDGLMDWVIGNCDDLEEGVLFDPECLLRLELARRVVSDPGGPMAGHELPESKILLTPVGRAVMEMAWVGALALIHFPR